MKCSNCGFEGLKREFKYVYAPTTASTISTRKCPQCKGWVEVDEIAEAEREKKMQEKHSGG